jgi:GH24 family phage-related lysozyme (muramidase)
MNQLPPADALGMAEAFVEYIEGFRPQAYWDSFGRVWTVGTGLTRLNGQPVTAHTVISRAQNDAALAIEFDLSVRAIQRLVVPDLTAGGYAALVSGLFNVGAGLLEYAGVPTRVLSSLNDGQMALAWDSLRLFRYAKGVLVGGLQDRRELERAIALGLLDPRNTSALEAMHASVTNARRTERPIQPTPISDADALMDAEIAKFKEGA